MNINVGFIMISSKTIYELYQLLNQSEVQELKSSITETFGADVESEVDKSPVLQQKINYFIYQYIHLKHPERTDKILFDANESAHEVVKTEHLKSEPVPLLKDFVSNSSNKSLAPEEQKDVIAVTLPAELSDIPVEPTNQNHTGNNEVKHDYNIILDGRTKLNILLERYLSGVDDVAREIIVKCFLVISIFVALISLVMVLLNTTNINQIQEMYDIDHKTFLFQYAEVCNVNVEVAKANPCVISEINKRISELSNSRFWNTFGVVLFSLLSCFFFYHISTYRDSKDKHNG